MCLSSFHSEDKLNGHKIYCGKHKCAKMLMPKLNENILYFKHYNRSLKVPFVVYADFESMLIKSTLVNLLMKHVILMLIRNTFQLIFLTISSTVMEIINHQLNILEQMLLECFMKN